MPHDHHGHVPGHHHHHEGGSASSLRAAFFLNLFFTVIEIVGGIYTNSMAILSDAVHDLGDSAALASSWMLERLSEKGRTEKQTFGYKRYSVLGALISALILIIGSIFILSKAIPRLLAPEEVKADAMVVVAIVGVVINSLAVFKLRGGTKLNQRVVFLHLLEDALGWVAVLIGSLVMVFTDLPIIDPILSIAITLYVLTKIIPNLKSALRIFLQYVPDSTNMTAVKDALSAVDSVVGIHDTHLWSLDGDYSVFTAHIVVETDFNWPALQQVKLKLQEILSHLGIQHSTLEFEPTNDICPDCALDNH
ncbi:MAG: cation transporter [Spirochaetales bacterium]|jgi:cobalt-zinc-cadmium efflux system protein|nr:cation transporter [Spirochaetales bacterium]